MRKVILSWALLLGLVGVFQPAKADFRSGSCALSMNFTFNPPLKLGAGPAGSKTFTLAYSSISPHCFVSPTQVTDPLIRTSWGTVNGGEATTNGLTWTCGSFLGTALWAQNFNPGLSVPPANATMTMSVGQGATIIISSNLSSFQGIIEIAGVPPVTQCNGAGLASFNATGAMVFHDPTVP
jgi:hypothetical protein